MEKHLILGGARSGKSSYAEKLALETASSATYIATAQALDEEMAKRIQHHKTSRHHCWLVIEEPIQLASCLENHDSPDSCVLIDCLTLWLNNCLAEDTWDEERALFIDTATNFSGKLLMVSNEVGSGIVPLGELSRQFVDEAGRLHQELANICNRVSLVVAGLPLNLKDNL